MHLQMSSKPALILPYAYYYFLCSSVTLLSVFCMRSGAFGDNRLCNEIPKTQKKNRMHNEVPLAPLQPHDPPGYKAGAPIIPNDVLGHYQLSSAWPKWVDGSERNLQLIASITFVQCAPFVLRRLQPRKPRIIQRPRKNQKIGRKGRRRGYDLTGLRCAKNAANRART